MDALRCSIGDVYRTGGYVAPCCAELARYVARDGLVAE